MQLLATAAKPMIMCGAGAQHAAREVEQLAAALQAPVTAFRSGRGIVPEDHPLGVASVAARELWDDVDVLVGVGSRLEMPYLRWGDAMRYERKPSHGPKLIRIDIDPKELQRFEPDVAIVADSAAACRALAERLQSPRQTEPRPPRRDRRSEAHGRSRVRAHRAANVVSASDSSRPTPRRYPRAGAVAGRVRHLHGRVSGVGAAHIYLGRVPRHTRVRFPDGARSQGRQPGKAVVSVTGDGGFMFGVQELATAAQYGIALVTIVFNNHSFANVLRDQQQQFGGRTIGSRLTNPDFVRLAESFGVAARRVTAPSELRTALEQELAAGRPALIEVALTPGVETTPWPFIHMRRRPSELLRA